MSPMKYVRAQRRRGRRGPVPGSLAPGNPEGTAQDCLVPLDINLGILRLSPQVLQTPVRAH